MLFYPPSTLCQILSLLLLGTVGITHAQEVKDLSKGQAVFICGHSFHIFIEKPLEALAKEAGFTAHQTVGTSTIGGSRVMQHWELPAGKNPAKEALLTGQVDVLTLAPIAKVPDDGIDRFAELAFAHNPNIRVMVQISWPTNPLSPQTNWDAMPFLFGTYMTVAQQQADAINAHLGRNVVSFVPVATAYFRLREEILAGKIPGIANFSELFRDEVGHPKPPLENLVTFCCFAAIYGQSPENLTALDSPATSVSRETNRVLQKIAWETVSQASSNGVKSP